MNVPSNVTELAVHGAFVLKLLVVTVYVYVGCNGTLTVAVKITGFDALGDGLNE